MQPDPHRYAGFLKKAFLHNACTSCGLYGALEGRYATVTVKLDDPAAVGRHLCLQHLPELLQMGQRQLLVALHEGGVAGNVGKQDGGEAAGLLIRHNAND